MTREYLPMMCRTVPTRANEPSISYWSDAFMLPVSRWFASVPAVVALLAALWALPAFADPRDFNVANNSSIVLTHVYVSPSDTADWGDDIMGRDVLNAGENVNVTFARFDGTTCLYDVQVIGQQGQSGVLYKIDLCSISNVSFSDGN
jgi:hypothetical protein